MSSRSSNDFEGAQFHFGWFLGGPGGSEVFRFDKDLTSERELGCWKSFRVHKLLVSLSGLRNVFLKESG